MAGEYDWLGPLIGGALGGYGASQGTTQTQGVAPEFQPLANAVSQRGMEIGNMGYTPYGGNLVSGFSPYQFAGMDMIANRATQGSPLLNQAEAAAGNILGGGAMGQTYRNPYSDALNKFTGAQTQVGSNPYAGANPYLEQNIQNTLGDVAKTYNQTVAPTMAATAYKSGSFGNAGQQEMEAASRDQLQRNLGRISGDMRMQDYGMQQGLAEADISRRMGAQQQDLARNSGLYGADLSRNAGTWGQQNALNQQGYQSGMNNMLQALGMAPSIYSAGYMPGQQLLGIGGTMQQQGQRYLDADYSQFQQAQQWPFKTYDAMLAPFSTRAVESSTTESSSPWAGALGGAMIGGKLWPSLFPPKP